MEFRSCLQKDTHTRYPSRVVVQTKNDQVRHTGGPHEMIHDDSPFNKRIAEDIIQYHLQYSLISVEARHHGIQ